MAPTDTLRLRGVDSSGLVGGRSECLRGEAPLSVTRILDAVVVAVATDWRVREVRRLGDSFGAGTDTYALSRLLVWVEIFDGGALRAVLGM